MRRGFLALACGVVGVVSATTALIVLDRVYSERQATWTHYSACITDLTEDAGDSSGGTVTVRFRGSDGARTAQIHVGTARDYAANLDLLLSMCDLDPVTVLVNPRDSTEVTLPGENYLPGWVPWTLVPVIVACTLLGVLGAATAFRQRMIAATLAMGPWRSRWVQTLLCDSGNQTTLFGLIEEDDDRIVLKRFVESRGLPRDARFRAEVAGTQRLVIRGLETPVLALTQQGEPKFGTRRGRMLVRKAVVSDAQFSMRLTDDEGEVVYVVRDPKVATRADVQALRGASHVDVMDGPGSLVILTPVGSEAHTLAERMSMRKAKKELSTLFEPFDRV
jgi:hypothetical protein